MAYVLTVQKDYICILNCETRDDRIWNCSFKYYAPSSPRPFHLCYKCNCVETSFSQINTSLARLRLTYSSLEISGILKALLVVLYFYEFLIICRHFVENLPVAIFIRIYLGPFF